MEKPRDCRNCGEKKSMQFLKNGTNDDRVPIKIFQCTKCTFREGLPIQHDKKSRVDSV